MGFVRLCCTTALAAVLATPAAAQTVATSNPTSTTDDSDSAARAEGGLQDIVVTARKVNENLQDVPVAVTVQTGEDLARQSARNVADVAALSPGLAIRPGITTPGSLTLFVRGQGQTSAAAVSDGSVGVYLDGIYVARTFGINTDLLDIQSVQILKGPQGTLFGRNTAGGALLIQTNDPDASAFSGSAGATLGQFDRQGGSLVVNVPIVTDKVALRVAVSTDRRDGYITETRTGTKMDNYDNQTARVKLLVQPSDNFRLLLEYDRAKTSGFSQPYRIVYADPNQYSPAAAAAVETLGAACPAPASAAAFSPACLAQGKALIQAAIGPANTDRFALNLLPRFRAVAQSYIGTAALDTGVGEFKLILGKRRIESDGNRDVDGSPFWFSDNGQTQDLSQFTGELQLTGKAINDRLSYVFGLFYFEEDGLDLSTTVVTPALTVANGGIGNRTLFDTSITAKSRAAYGQVSFEIVDGFSVTGGLRYSKEDKGITSRSRILNLATNVATCQLTVCPSSREDTFESTDYLIGADYKVTPDVLIYAKRSKGFRSGGQNGRALGNLSLFEPYGAEKTFANEIGLKSQFFGNRLRLNFSGYYNIVKDLQRAVTVVLPATPPVTATVTSNVGEIGIRGFELEADAALFEGFRLGGTIGHARIRYRNFIDPLTRFDRSRERIQFQPKWTYSITASYTHDLGFGRFSIRGDYSWQQHYDLTGFNIYTDGSGVVRDTSTNAVVPDVAAARDFIRVTTTPDTGVVNARASIEFGADRNYELAGFIRNLGNDRSVIGALPYPNPFGFVAVQRREPRMWGVSGTVRW